ncbi:hypothetical protein NPX13_g3418 [Xylaria arbuscula]|uniref:Histone chaperone domain-containing protein n=1 Tax=Xylaria arbuscula TaxID=114810 RepID=A0A9W8NIA6_9PEZI|nr:hypothetical protein NPX13_g3418 [Xylaria arbuscula]
MSKYSYSETDERRGQPEDIREAPTGEFNDNSYATERQAEAVPVVGDEASIEDPIQPEEADSDQQLARDENDAIDKSNIVNDRLRSDKPPKGALREPADEEIGLAEDEA